jgi:hypothetical protein
MRLFVVPLLLLALACTASADEEPTGSPAVFGRSTPTGWATPTPYFWTPPGTQGTAVPTWTPYSTSTRVPARAEFFNEDEIYEMIRETCIKAVGKVANDVAQYLRNDVLAERIRDRAGEYYC